MLERSPAGHAHARRILLKASNGVVAGNTFTEPKFIAAQITPEFYFQVRSNEYANTSNRQPIILMTLPLVNPLGFIWGVSIGLFMC